MKTWFPIQSPIGGVGLRLMRAGVQLAAISPPSLHILLTLSHAPHLCQILRNPPATPRHRTLQLSQATDESLSSTSRASLPAAAASDRHAFRRLRRTIPRPQQLAAAKRRILLKISSLALKSS